MVYKTSKWNYFNYIFNNETETILNVCGNFVLCNVHKWHGNLITVFFTGHAQNVNWTIKFTLYSILAFLCKTRNDYNFLFCHARSIIFILHSHAKLISSFHYVFNSFWTICTYNWRNILLQDKLYWRIWLKICYIVIGSH